MGVRIPSSQWVALRRQVDVLPLVSTVFLDLELGALKQFWKNKKKRKKEDQLSMIFAWCDEYLSHQYYVTTSICRYSGYVVAFHFFNEADAVLFKLTWWKM